MRGAQFVGIVAVGVDADIFVPRFVLGHDAVQLGVLSEEKLVSFLEHKPRGLEVILTGHTVSDRILKTADYATLMTKIRHPYDKGISAREGIEY